MSFFRASQIALGPFLLSTSLLYILIGIGAGSIFLFIITKKDKLSRKFSSDIITNSFLIIILTWKLLPIILTPGDIISNPVTILYSSGGSIGIGLGIVFGIVYLVIKLILYWKHSVGAKDFLPLRDVLKPVIVFFVSAAFVSSSLFFVSFLIRENIETENNKNEDVRSYVSIGNTAPDFDLRDIDGKLVSLVDYKGKWVILNFWATWCPPCKAELPTLNRFYNKMDKDNVILLGINASGTERPKGGEDIRSYVSTFATENGINFPILLDSKGMVSTLYEAENLPTTIIISPEGLITKIKTGVVDSFWLRLHSRAGSLLPTRLRSVVSGK